jgi:hypothetical protein
LMNDACGRRSGRNFGKRIIIVPINHLWFLSRNLPQMWPKIKGFSDLLAGLQLPYEEAPLGNLEWDSLLDGVDPLGLSRDLKLLDSSALLVESPAINQTIIELSLAFFGWWFLRTRQREWAINEAKALNRNGLTQRIARTSAIPLEGRVSKVIRHEIIVETSISEV